MNGLNNSVPRFFLRLKLFAYLQETSQISINDAKTTDGASYLELKIPKSKPQHGFWNFLDKYGFRYGDKYTRPLLASEVVPNKLYLIAFTYQSLIVKLLKDVPLYVCI